MPSKLPTVSPDVVAQSVGDEIVLVHLRTNDIYALNDTAARFWELFTGGMQRPEIERVLLEEFDVPQEQLERELDDLLDELEQRHIVLGAA
jgi:coenzyme PQQ synthesis protein D (PqqD)